MAALLRDAGLGERLRLLGYRDDVPDLMAAADIFVLPSQFEGLPMSVIEAMLTGLPVVAASDVAGRRSRCVPEVTGLLVPPGDASRRWPRRWQRLGGGRRHCGPHGRGWPRARGGAVTMKPRWWRGPLDLLGVVARKHVSGARGIAMTDIVPIRRALISVSDKAGLVPFAQALAAHGVEILSTGGSATGAARGRRDR